MLFQHLIRFQYTIRFHYIRMRRSDDTQFVTNPQTFSLKAGNRCQDICDTARDPRRQRAKQIDRIVVQPFIPFYSACQLRAMCLSFRLASADVTLINDLPPGSQP